METCDKHQCIEEELKRLTNNRRFWQRVFDSRYSHFLITGILILSCMFVGWTVNEIYAQKANEKENKKTAEVICEKMQEIKTEMKEIKDEIKTDRNVRTDQREKDKEMLMKILTEIKKR